MCFAIALGLPTSGHEIARRHRPSATAAGTTFRLSAATVDTTHHPGGYAISTFAQLRTAAQVGPPGRVAGCLPGGINAPYGMPVEREVPGT